MVCKFNNNQTSLHRFCVKNSLKIPANAKVMMNSTNRLFIVIIFLLVFSSGWSQALEEVPPPEYITTVTFRSAQFDGNLPIVLKGESIRLQFDDLYGDEADYYYRIIHCDQNWAPSPLSKTEYLAGVDEQRIVHYKNSLNTLQLYTHYTLTLPNEKTALKLSGNYMVEILDKNFKTVFSRKLMVVEPLLPVEVYTRRVRDMKMINQKQTVQFVINTASYLIDNPTQNLHVKILQNYRWDNRIEGVKPQYTTGYDLIYRYDSETAFWGGNEFLNFDTKDIRSSSERVKSVQFQTDTYITYLYEDEIRAGTPYTYYPDINGRFLVRTLNGQDTDIESEYSWVNFTLLANRPIPDAEVHVFGAFNNYQLNDETKMFYDGTTSSYKTRLYLKQGFYNYTYVLYYPTGILDAQFLNGSYFQTENNYTVLIYFRKFGDRHDSLIGFGEGNSKYITD